MPIGLTRGRRSRGLRTKTYLIAAEHEVDVTADALEDARKLARNVPAQMGHRVGTALFLILCSSRRDGPREDSNNLTLHPG